ncbi:30S ribosomal protein S11 [bacterium]|nr:MAG: 30S ribosomal protein S11 [bacterium]
MGKKTIKKVSQDPGKLKTAVAGSSKKSKKKVTSGQAHIQSTYNNTMVSLTDNQGEVIGWSSAGSIGFKGAKKATPYAAGLVAKNAVEKSKKSGLREVDVFIKGVGPGRESAARALIANGMIINSIKDVTPIPHNGCRPPKVRRV